MMDIEEQELRRRFGETLTLIDPEDYDLGIDDLEDGQWFPEFYVEALDGSDG